MTISCPELESNPSKPWNAPEGAGKDRLQLHDGGEPRLATRIALWRTPSALRLLFDMEDERRIDAPHLTDDEPLWEHDVVEVFLSPTRLEEYYELELNPRATRFTAHVLSPDLDRATMTVDEGWDSSGFHGLVRRDSGSPFWQSRVFLEIPFADLGASPPQASEKWRANFYRIDRSDNGDEYSAWSPAANGSPDFHQPLTFGTIEFI